MQQWICHIKGLDSVFGAREVERVGRQMDGVERLVVDYAGETLQLSAASREVLKRLEIKLGRLGYKILDKGYMVKTVIGIDSLDENRTREIVQKIIGNHTFVQNLKLNPLSKTIELIHSSDYSISDFICELNNIGIKAKLRRQLLAKSFWQKFSGLSIFVAVVSFFVGFSLDLYVNELAIAFFFYALSSAILIPEMVFKTNRKFIIEKKFNYEILLLFVIGITLFSGLWFETAFIVICMALLRRREFKLGAILKQRWSVESGYESEFAFVKSTAGRIAVSTKELAVGDIVNVQSGEIIPVDGLIQSGEGILTEENITSTFNPIKKESGGIVFAGQILKSGEIDIRITALASESVIATLHRQFESLQSQITDSQSKVIQYTQFSIYLSGFVLLSSLIALIFSPVFTVSWMEVTLSIMIVSSASYIVVSLQYSQLFSFVVAAKNGLYFIHPKFWQKLSNVSTIILEKNGVVTSSKPEVQEVISFSGFAIKDVFNIAASLANVAYEERLFPVNNRAVTDNILLQTVTDVEIEKGQFVKGRIEGKYYCIGSQGVMNDAGLITRGIAQKLKRWQEEGANIILVSDETRIFGLITIIDPVREVIPDFVDFAHDKLRLKVVLLTQENEGTNQVLVNRYGFDEVITQVVDAKPLVDSSGQEQNNYTLFIANQSDKSIESDKIIPLMSDTLRSQYIAPNDSIISLGVRMMAVLNLIVMARKISKRLKQLSVTVISTKIVMLLGILLGFLSLGTVVGLEFILCYWVLFSTYRPVELLE